MSRDLLQTTAKELVAACRENRVGELQDKYYHPDCVSVEAMAIPGTDSPESRGLEAIKAKHAWWDKTMEVHSQVVDGPYPHGDDRFAVIFEFDTSNRETGERRQMKEVAVYTVDQAGKVVREEFFYGS